MACDISRMRTPCSGGVTIGSDSGGMLNWPATPWIAGLTADERHPYRPKTRWLPIISRCLSALITGLVRSQELFLHLVPGQRVLRISLRIAYIAAQLRGRRLVTTPAQARNSLGKWASNSGSVTHFTCCMMRLHLGLVGHALRHTPAARHARRSGRRRRRKAWRTACPRLVLGLALSSSGEAISL